MTNLTQIGSRAENIAAKYLINKGYSVLEMNFRRKMGEIDIIAERDGIIIFIEVKANTRDVFGFEAELRANRTKMRKVLLTARTWLAKKGINPEGREWRIDVMGVYFKDGGGLDRIEHFENIDV